VLEDPHIRQEGIGAKKRGSAHSGYSIPHNTIHFISLEAKQKFISSRTSSIGLLKSLARYTLPSNNNIDKSKKKGGPYTPLAKPSFNLGDKKVKCLGK
jgi:hypothetical protein